MRDMNLFVSCLKRRRKRIMYDMTKIIKNRIDDGKYTENDILNLAIKIYYLIKENPSARRLAIKLYRDDCRVEYCTILGDIMSAENPVEAIKYIVELMVKKLDGLDNIYLYKPVRFASTFDIDFLELRVLIEWSCYYGNEEENKDES
jgi:hypothetical protein